MIELDQIDAELLDALQADGRASFEALGRRVGLTRIAARNRVHRLQDAGVIQVITAVHPEAAGLKMFGHLTVQVTGPATPIAATMARSEDLPFVALVTGPFAIIAEARTRDLTSLRHAVDKVLQIPGVANVSSCLYTERIIDRHSAQRVAGPTEPLHLDPADIRLIETLKRDGRATFTQLADQTSLSATSVRSRTRRLIDSGAVHIGAIVRPGATTDLGHVCGFGLRTDDAANPAGQLAQIPQVHYLTHCLGNWNMIGTLMCRNPTETATVLDTIRAATAHVESWSHLTLVKEDYTVPLPPSRGPAGAT